MLFTCRPPNAIKTGAPIPGRFPGPAHRRGKWFTLDIHCHVRSDKAAGLVAGHEEVSRWFLETAASERSRERLMAAGFRAHVVKPFQLADLVTAIEQAADASPRVATRD